MYQTSRAIVLHRTAYSDRYDIIQIYTEQLGRRGVLLPNSSRSAKALRTQLSPLTEVELTFESKPGKDLVRVRDCRVLQPLFGVRSHPTKSGVGLYLSELLYRSLTHTEPDPELYTFVSASIALFDGLQRGIANFHLCFTWLLLEQLAISPRELLLHGSPLQGAWLDLHSLSYHKHPEAGQICLSPNEAEYLPLFLRMNYRNMHLYRYNRQQRNYILDRLLLYYQLHIPSFPKIRSLEILRSSAG